METPVNKEARKPGRPYHSQLAPYAAQIARWRREGKSYQEIAGVLAERGVKVHRDTINSFVLVRARGGGKVAVLPEPKEPAPAAAQQSPLAADLPAVDRDSPSAEAGPETAVERARARLREGGDQAGQRTPYAPANPADL